MKCSKWPKLTFFDDFMKSAKIDVFWCFWVFWCVLMMIWFYDMMYWLNDTEVLQKWKKYENDENWRSGEKGRC